MNMKFMKRKIEIAQNEEKRNSAMITSAGATHISLTCDPPNHHPTDMEAKNEHSPESPLDAMCMSNDHQHNNVLQYEQATSIDMYGLELCLIGRRSFLGFNPAIERAWKDSKASIENRGNASKLRQKITDEELLERYEDTVKERGRGGDTVGNLDNKGKRRKRKGLR